MTKAKGLGILIVWLALVIAGCSGDSDEDVIEIGLITDLSGRFVGFGSDIEAATQLAVDEINAGGGVNGSRLQIELIDTGGEPDQAVIGFGTLVDDGVFAVSGPVSSGEAEVLFLRAAEALVPIVTGTANKENITENGGGWAFRNHATNLELYSVAMPVWKDEYGVDTAVLVYDEEEPVTASAARGAIPAVAATLEIDIVNADSPITFKRGQTDFSTTVQRIRETEAKALIIISAPAEAGLLARELARQGELRPILGHPAQASDSFFSQGRSSINDWVLPTILDLASTAPATQTYFAAIAAVDDDPPTVHEAANHYDIIYLLAEIMEAAGIDGGTDPEEARAMIREGLLSIEFDGVTGSFSFDANGDAVKPVYVNVVMAGELQPLG